MSRRHTLHEKFIAHIYVSQLLICIPDRTCNPFPITTREGHAQGRETGLMRNCESRENERRGESTQSMAPGSGDAKVLNFGDVTLRRSDVERLKQPEELNDQIIEFFFEHQTSKLRERVPQPLLLVGPSQTYWLLHCPPDALYESLNPMSLPEREMIIFALNDNPDPTIAEGGCHWSLVVYSRPQNIFEHYDSLGGLNAGVAQHFVNKIKSHMGKGASQAKLRDCESPQQQNGYDCGVYVMMTGQLLCNAFEQHQRAVTFADIEDSLRTEITPASVEEMRESTVKLILELAKQSSSKK